MIFESKYNFGDAVYSIEKIESNKWEECLICSGEGEIVLNNKKYTCPECSGYKGRKIYTGRKWKVDYQPKTIENIRVSIYSSKFKCNSNKDNYSYMCNETGVGSGVVWYQSDLYESEIIAQEKCNKLNEIIENKREQIKNKILNGRTMSQYGLWSELEKEINQQMKEFDEQKELNKLS